MPCYATGTFKTRREKTESRLFRRKTGYAAISAGIRIKKTIPGSMPFVPPVAGFIMASQVVLDLLKSSGGEK